MIGKRNGTVFVFIAAVLWSFGGLCAKFIPWNPLTITALRSLFCAVVIGFFTKKWIVHPNRIVLLSALCTAGSSSLFIIANKMTSAANAIVLQYTSPVFVIIMCVIVFKVKPRLIDLISIAVILGGISLFFIEHLGHGALLGDILSILSGICFAGIFFLNSLPGANPEDSSYLGALFNLVWLPMMFFDSSFANFEIAAWGVVIFAGVFQLGIGYLAFSKGIKTTPPVTASIICTIEPILNPIWVFLFMGERPGTLAMFGAAIVIVTIACYNVLNIKAKVPEKNLQA